MIRASANSSDWFDPSSLPWNVLRGLAPIRQSAGSRSFALRIRPGVVRDQARYAAFDSMSHLQHW
jgi:hypothetical protein